MSFGAWMTDLHEKNPGHFSDDGSPNTAKTPKEYLETGLTILNRLLKKVCMSRGRLVQNKYTKVHRVQLKDLERKGESIRKSLSGLASRKLAKKDTRIVKAALREYVAFGKKCCSTMKACRPHMKKTPLK